MKLLQRAVGLAEDGVLGPVTASTVNALPPAAVLGGFKLEAAKYYRAVVEAHPDRARPPQRAGA